MTEIWEQPVRDRRAVMHGTAIRYIAWLLGSDGRWQMRGAFWSRDEAERAVA